MINTYHLFAVPLIQTKLVIQHSLLNKIKNWCIENNKNNDLFSIRKGFQEHEKFEGKEELDEIINNFFKIYFTQKIHNSWLNVLNKSGQNVPHVHTGDDVVNSAVLYLTNKNSTITFIQNSQIFNYEPQLFDLLIFPSSLVHQVSVHTNDEIRISYAMNTMKL